MALAITFLKLQKYIISECSELFLNPNNFPQTLTKKDTHMIMEISIFFHFLIEENTQSNFQENLMANYSIRASFLFLHGIFLS